MSVYVIALMIDTIAAALLGLGMYKREQWGITPILFPIFIIGVFLAVGVSLYIAFGADTAMQMLIFTIIHAIFMCVGFYSAQSRYEINDTGAKSNPLTEMTSENA